MRFQPRVDIYAIPPALRRHLQPGQHIQAAGAPGRWCGQTRAGVDVAAWAGNAAGYPGGRAAYFRALRDYARAGGAR